MTDPREQVREQAAKVVDGLIGEIVDKYKDGDTVGHYDIGKLDALRMARETIRAMPLADGAGWQIVSSKAATDVLAERKRQVEQEGWTPEHDDEHGNGEIADAAACYALTKPAMHDPDGLGTVPKVWPWDFDDWKPKDRRRNLVRAGALILAEIDRLDRTMLSAAPHPEPEKATCKERLQVGESGEREAPVGQAGVGPDPAFLDVLQKTDQPLAIALQAKLHSCIKINRIGPAWGAFLGDNAIALIEAALSAASTRAIERGDHLAKPLPKREDG